MYTEIFSGEQLANLANRELFANANIHRHTENVFGIYTNCSLFVNFSLPMAFICTVWPLPVISRAWYYTIENLLFSYVQYVLWVEGL